MGGGRFSILLTVWLALSGPVLASDLLGDIDCAFLVVEEPGEGAVKLELTPDFLYASLKVGVTESLPRIAISPEECGTDIYLRVMAVSAGETGARSLDYTALVRLEVRRLARVLDTEAQGMATVWDAAVMLGGNPDQAKQTILGTVRDLAAEMAAASQSGSAP